VEELMKGRREDPKGTAIGVSRPGLTFPGVEGKLRPQFCSAEKHRENLGFYFEIFQLLQVFQHFYQLQTN